MKKTSKEPIIRGDDRNTYFLSINPNGIVSVYKRVKDAPYDFIQTITDPNGKERVYDDAQFIPSVYGTGFILASVSANIEFYFLKGEYFEPIDINRSIDSHFVQPIDINNPIDSHFVQNFQVYFDKDLLLAGWISENGIEIFELSVENFGTEVMALKIAIYRHLTPNYNWFAFSSSSVLFASNSQFIFKLDRTSETPLTKTPLPNVLTGSISPTDPLRIIVLTDKEWLIYDDNKFIVKGELPPKASSVSWSPYGVNFAIRSSDNSIHEYHALTPNNFVHN